MSGLYSVGKNGRLTTYTERNKEGREYKIAQGRNWFNPPTQISGPGMPNTWLPNTGYGKSKRNNTAVPMAMEMRDPEHEAQASEAVTAAEYNPSLLNNNTSSKNLLNQDLQKWQPSLLNNNTSSKNLLNQDPQKWQPPNNLGSVVSTPSSSLLNGNPNNNAFVKALQPHARPLNANAAIPPGFIPEGLFNPKKRLVRQQGQRNLIFGNAMANLRQKQATQAAKPAWKRMLGFGGKSRSRRRRHHKTRKNRRS
jgi:hypothetical protein